MIPSTFQIPLWAELTAAGLGGVQGAVFAAAFKDRRIDVLGVVVLGIGVALGGSLLRDILLNQDPVVIRSNWYLVVAGAAALIGMALLPVFLRLTALVTLLDALVLGAFAAIGSSKALALGAPEVPAVLVGVIGAVGGSILRDVSLNLPIAFLNVGSLYAVAATAGATALVALVAFGAPVPVAGVACVVITTGLRLAAVRFGWTFPAQAPLRAPRLPRFRRLLGAANRRANTNRREARPVLNGRARKEMP